MKNSEKNTAKPADNKETKAAAPEDNKIRQMKKAVRYQIFLAVGTLLVVIVLVFAMTSAWYTNVSKMSSLSFSVDAWGYSAENITVPKEALAVAPGGSGVIPLRVDNSTGSEKVRITVSVSKDSMPSELKQRLYFYADKTEAVNNENVSRLYLGSSEADSYTYTLLPGQVLVLSNDYYNDVPLKWAWVYDRLGYYFRGTVTGGENSNVAVSEYVRPIEYDLNNAVFNENGELVSVDGTSLDDILYDVSSRDGYAGTVSASDAVVALNRKYYPVSVDSEGKGIWAYFCSESEINSGINYDTNQLAAIASSINVTLNITAENIPVVIEEVSTDADLRNALLDPDIDVVQLQNDIDLSTTFNVFANMNGTIDLNGNDINYTGEGASYAVMHVEEGAVLTVMNGAVHGKGGSSSTAGGGTTTSIAFECAGADLTISGVTIDNVGSAVYAADSQSSGRDSNIRLFNCNIDTQNTSLFVMGNNTASDAPTHLIVEGCSVSSGYIAVSGNGNANNRGTEYVLIDSTLYGYWAAIYQPHHNATTLISGCTLSGYTGIAVKGGVVTVNNSNITGTGAYHAAARANSGWTDTGDGIYIEAGYDWNASVTVKGNSTVQSVNAYAAELFGVEGDGYGDGKLYIYGGTYESHEGMLSVNFNNIGVARIYGGTFPNGVSEYVTRYDQD